MHKVVGVLLLCILVFVVFLGNTAEANPKVVKNLRAKVLNVMKTNQKILAQLNSLLKKKASSEESDSSSSDESSSEDSSSSDEQGQEEDTNERCVKRRYINVRDGEGNLVRSLKRGQKVKVTGQQTLSGIVLAQIGDDEFVNAKYLMRHCTEKADVFTPKEKITEKDITKTLETLDETYKVEATCQKWDQDKRYQLEGQVGESCYGVLPRTGYKYRELFEHLNFDEFEGQPADFVRWAYDQDPTKFRDVAAQIFANKFNRAGCLRLRQPAFHICAHIVIDGGVKRAANYLNELGAPRKGETSKSYARRLNERNRKDNIVWTSHGKFRALREILLNKSNKRDEFIKNYYIPQ